jgi:hypothetical protein
VRLLVLRFDGLEVTGYFCEVDVGVPKKIRKEGVGEVRTMEGMPEVLDRCLDIGHVVLDIPSNGLSQFRRLDTAIELGQAIEKTHSPSKPRGVCLALGGRLTIIVRFSAGDTLPISSSTKLKEEGFVG